jgi:hypothetical protein
VKEETLPSGAAISHLVANRPASVAGILGGGGARYIVEEYGRGACGAMPAAEFTDLPAQHPLQFEQAPTARSPSSAAFRLREQ